MNETPLKPVKAKYTHNEIVKLLDNPEFDCYHSNGALTSIPTIIFTYELDKEPKSNKVTITNHYFDGDKEVGTTTKSYTNTKKIYDAVGNCNYKGTKYIFNRVLINNIEYGVEQDIKGLKTDKKGNPVIPSNPYLYGNQNVDFYYSLNSTHYSRLLVTNHIVLPDGTEKEYD